MGGVTAEEAAALAGIAVSTWRSYVTRGQAPPATGFDPVSGRRVWDRVELSDWLQRRPGQGARTDLLPQPDQPDPPT